MAEVTVRMPASKKAQTFTITLWPDEEDEPEGDEEDDEPEEDMSNPEKYAYSCVMPSSLNGLALNEGKIVSNIKAFVEARSSSAALPCTNIPYVVVGTCGAKHFYSDKAIASKDHTRTCKICFPPGVYLLECPCGLEHMFEIPYHQGMTRETAAKYLAEFPAMCGLLPGWACGLSQRYHVARTPYMRPTTVEGKAEEKSKVEPKNSDGDSDGEEVDGDIDKSICPASVVEKGTRGADPLTPAS